MKKITLCLVMLLIGMIGWSQTENFDDPSVTSPTALGSWVLPSGTWRVLDNGVGTASAQLPNNNWKLNVDANPPYPSHSGTKAAFIDRFNLGVTPPTDPSEDYLVTPLLTVPVNPQLRFYTRTTISGPQGTVYQLRSAPATADPNVHTSYTNIIQEWTESNLTGIGTPYDQYREVVVDLTLAPQTQVYLAFVRVNRQTGPAATGDRWLIDDFKFVSRCIDVASIVPACLHNRVNLSWANPSGATSFAIHVVPAGTEFDPLTTTATPIIANTNTGFDVTQTTFPAVTNIAPNTGYDFYVRANCDLSESGWVKVSCITQTAPPECGGNYTDSGGATGDYGNNQNIVTTICPQNPGDLVTVTFTAFNTETNYDGIYVFDGMTTSAPKISSTNGVGFGPMTSPGAYWGTAIPGPFTSTSPDGCLTFQFVSDGGGVRTGFVANITCNPPPACPKPGAVTSTTINPTNATITWSNVAPANDYEILVLPAGSPAPNASSTGTVGVSSPYQVNNLSSGTCFVVYLRAICTAGGNGVGDWTLGYNFCTPVAPPECGGNLVDNGGANGTYTANSNNTYVICPQNPGDVVTVIFTQFNTEPNYDGLYVYNGNSASAPMIPSTNAGGNNPVTAAGAYWGTTIPGPFTSTSADGCLTFVFKSDGSGQRDGFLANILCGPAPTCPMVQSLVANSTTHNSATLTWPSTGTQWEVIALPCSATYPANNAVGIIANTNTNFVYPDLNPDTCYKFFVRNVCDGETSLWSTGVTATTLLVPPACGGVFTDTAGANANYPSGVQNVITTICPDVPGDVVTVTFVSFNTEANYDGIYIYDGNSVNAPMIPSSNGPGNGTAMATPGAYWGTTNPGTFQSTSADGCLTFHFRTDSGGTREGWVANITCGPPPVCIRPSGLNVTPSTYSAALSWTSNDNEAAWQVIAVPCGSPIPADNAAWINAPTNPFTIEGLSQQTCYDFYVRANCTGTDEGYSTPSTPKSATTLIAPPECGGLFTDSGGLAGNYTNSANDTWTICPEEPGDVVRVTFNSFETETSWDALYVYNGNSISAPQIPSTNGSGNVPGGVAGGFWGTTIPGPFTSSSPDGCLTFVFRSDGGGTRTGWSATVMCTPCDNVPTGLSVFSQPNSATLNWDLQEGLLYDIYVVPQGSAAPTRDTEPSYSNIGQVPFTTDMNLSPETNYTFYVRAQCPGGDSTTPWVPMNFVTPEACPDPTFISYEASPNEAMVTWYENGYATQWEVWILPIGSPAPQPGTGLIFTQSPLQNPVVFNSSALAGLDPLFPGSYDFYFRSICEEDSDIVGPNEIYVVAPAQICVDVTPISPDINEEGEIILCSTDACVDLSATYTDSRATTSYIVEPIPFIPPFPINGGISLFQDRDDRWATRTQLPFNFCFYGNTYTSLRIGANGVIGFSVADGPDVVCPWDINAGNVVPSTGFPIKNAIYGVYQDIEPNDTPYHPYSINYQIIGEEPCRVLVVNYYNVPLYSESTGCAQLDPQTSQIVLYETSNNIEVYVKKRTSCSSWNEGLGVIGIQNAAGTQGLTPPNRNTGTWNATNEAWRFKPNGESLVTFSWLKDGDFYSSDLNISVCASERTVMTAQAVYNRCGGIVTTKSSDVTLIPVAAVLDPIEDVYVCDTYILPALAVGNYYTAGGGLGDVVPAGTEVTETQTFYVYHSVETQNSDCFAEETFTVHIGSQSIDNPGDQEVCGSFTLPALANGNYYTAINGGGAQLAAGTEITETQTIWVYAAHDICPAQDSFEVVVHTTTELEDPHENINQCVAYTLPTPTVGHYYSGANGTGDILDGEVLGTGTHNVYLYASFPGCDPVEAAFTVSITEQLAPFTPVDVTGDCSYTLPAIPVGYTYWTAAGGNTGTGTELNAGDVIHSTQIVHVYGFSAGCPPIELSFEVTINSPGNFDHLNATYEACNTFTLPEIGLAGAGYYNATGGNDPIISSTFGPGIYTVYAYNVLPGNPTCFVEKEIVIRVGESIDLGTFPNQEACGSYTLETAPAGAAYYSASGGNSADLISGPITQSMQVYVYAPGVNVASCASEVSFNVQINQAPEIQILGECQGNKFVLTAVDQNGNALPAGATYTWSGPGLPANATTASIVVDEIGTYIVTVVSNDCTGFADDYQVTSIACLIQKGISANNDGVNDTFDLVGQNVAHLSIFNRYGMKVYEMANYSNEWRGQSDKGDDLPDATYYYVIEFKDAKPTQTGWIYLNRKN